MFVVICCWKKVACCLVSFINSFHAFLVISVSMFRTPVSAHVWAIPFHFPLLSKKLRTFLMITLDVEPPRTDRCPAGWTPSRRTPLTSAPLLMKYTFFREIHFSLFPFQVFNKHLYLWVASLHSLVFTIHCTTVRHNYHVWKKRTVKERISWGPIYIYLYFQLKPSGARVIYPYSIVAALASVDAVACSHLSLATRATAVTVSAL